MSDDSADLVPKAVRSAAYIGGTLLSGVGTAMVAADADPVPTAILTGLGTACLALAVGYRPTRKQG